MLANEELILLIKSRYPVIFVESIDEQYVVNQLRQIADQLGLAFYQWSVTAGLQKGSKEGGFYQTGEPEKMVKTVLTLVKDRSGDRQETTIGLVTKAMDSEFWLTVGEGAKAAGGAHAGVGLTIGAPDREINVDQQVSILEDQIRRGVNALVVAPAGSDQVMSALELAGQRGIPVILIDTDAPYAGKVTYIGTDNRKGGELAARCRIDRLGGAGDVALIGGVPGNESQDQRAQGFTDAIAREPRMRLVARQPANSERSLGLTVIENILTAHPCVKGVFCTNDQDSPT